jgi:hypothetical protein
MSLAVSTGGTFCSSMRLLLQDMSIETGTVEVWIRAKKEEPGWPTITARDASAEKQEPLLSEERRKW